MSNEADVKARLAEMAQLTLLSKRLSEVQQENLKSYPFIFFDGVTSVGISYDLMDKPNYIMYEMKSTVEPLDITFIHKRIEAIEGSIRTLLWSDINLILKINGTKIYESKDGQEN